MVMHAQVVGDLAAQPDAEQHGDPQRQPIAPVRQHLPQRDKWQGDQRAPGTGGFRQRAGAEAECHEMPGVAPYGWRYEFRRNLIGVISHLGFQNVGSRHGVAEFRHPHHPAIARRCRLLHGRSRKPANRPAADRPALPLAG